MNDHSPEARRRLRQRYKRLPGEPRSSGKESMINFYAIRTMAEVAVIMGLHKSRIHQLERSAFWKIRKVLGKWMKKLPDQFDQ